VIDPTDEMLVAWRDAMKAAAADAVKAGEPLGRSQEIARAGLVAVLAIVERDYDVRCGAVCPPERECGELRCCRLPSHSGEHRWFGDDIAVSWP
jgi:hypothetical protein